MTRISDALRHKLLGVPYREVSYARRGLRGGDPAVEARAEAYFTSFLDGYHLALVADSPAQLGERLDQGFSAEVVGFAYEGAGMCLALLDRLTPWRTDRLHRFVAGPAQRHEFITLIGIGFVLARLPWLRLAPAAALRRLDPGTAWFAFDGYGFHEGFFHHQRAVEQRRLPLGIHGYAARCFDNGLGRGIWFVKGADPDRIAAAIAAFPEARQPDLWAGIGLACAFAGGVHRDLGSYGAVLDRLAMHCGPAYRELRLGLVFAAYARYRAATPSPWTDLACEQLLGMSFSEAGQLGAYALEASTGAHVAVAVAEPRARRYEAARQIIRRAVAERRAAAPTPAEGQAVYG